MSRSLTLAKKMLSINYDLELLIISFNLKDIDKNLSHFNYKFLNPKFNFKKLLCDKKQNNETYIIDVPALFFNNNNSFLTFIKEFPLKRIIGIDGDFIPYANSMLFI